MYQIQLTDDVADEIMPTLNVPLTEGIIEGATDVTTLDMNLYTQFIAQKRLWSHTWKYMSEANFNLLKGFYDRQFTLFKYPLLTITEQGVENIVVRMTLSPRNIIDNCGTVEDVQVSFRETVQNTIDGSS
jgi:hypothetical protein